MGWVKWVGRVGWVKWVGSGVLGGVKWDGWSGLAWVNTLAK